MLSRKRTKYFPPAQNVDKIITLADPDTQDYLWTIREPMGRMGEINRLTRDDVDAVTLCTRKRRWSPYPRKVAMTQRLFDVLDPGGMLDVTHYHRVADSDSFSTSCRANSRVFICLIRSPASRFSVRRPASHLFRTSPISQRSPSTLGSSRKLLKKRIVFRPGPDRYL
jgi:hypothetical protein